MNHILQKVAREYLKENIQKLPEDWQHTFKLMYARNNGRRSVEEASLIPINDAIDRMPEESLDWAMIQVENSLIKLAKKSLDLNLDKSRLIEHETSA